MKQFAFILIVWIAVACETLAQIPNSGFENWALSGSCLHPQGWSCINEWMGTTENCYSMSRSDDHYPVSIGSYSIKIENNVSILPDLGAAGMVWTGDSTGFGTDNPVFPIAGHPTSLCGYYKFIPENGDTMDIHFVFYKNGVEVTSGRLMGKAPVPDWTPFKIPVTSPDYPAADSARIMMSSFYSDSQLIHGNSVLYVDNLSFDALISSTEDKIVQKTFFRFYPNPADNRVTLKFNKTINDRMLIEMYNQLGILVLSEMHDQNQQDIIIADLSEGIYMVTINSKKFSGKQKLIIYR